MIETKKKSQWLGVLSKKNFNSIIKHFLNIEFAKQYNKEIYNICKTAWFDIKSKIPRNINRTPFKTIII